MRFVFGIETLADAQVAEQGAGSCTVSLEAEALISVCTLALEQDDATLTAPCTSVPEAKE
jgi:hypothetical protein